MPVTLGLSLYIYIRMRKRLKTYFPGEFNPPTKYDLDIAKWLSRKTLDVSEVIIVIGKDKEGELTQADKEAIWDLYLGDNVSAPIKVVKSQNLSPLSYIYKEQENDRRSLLNSIRRRDIK